MATTKTENLIKKYIIKKSTRPTDIVKMLVEKYSIIFIYYLQNHRKKC